LERIRYTLKQITQTNEGVIPKNLICVAFVAVLDESLSQDERFCSIYGIVQRAKDVASKEVVALKKVRLENVRDGIPIGILREITLFLSLKHPNIVHPRQVIMGRAPDSIFLVMEYCEQDMAKSFYGVADQVYVCMLQLFKVLRYLHENFIIHRDMKVFSLLMTDKGLVKLANFGLSRPTHSHNAMTLCVVTFWHRAPKVELPGCTMGELLLHKPLLPGKSDIHQLDVVIDLLDNPNDQIWPVTSKLPMRLLNFLFMYSPARARKCCQSSYFREQPLPCGTITTTMSTCFRNCESTSLWLDIIFNSRMYSCAMPTLWQDLKAAIKLRHRMQSFRILFIFGNSLASEAVVGLPVSALLFYFSIGI
uniref:Protein kinase domain-containing protein n=1 Tax=Echinostoma caproni TaxID=27848 RepID=A0A183ACY9_9TREM